MRLRLLVPAIAVMVAVAPPLLFVDQGYGMRVVTMLLLYACMAQAWNIVGGLANQISLGHAAFFGIGAYVSTLLQIRLGITPWLGLFAAMGVAAVAGALLSLPTMRLRGHYFALATLAFGEVMRAIGNTWSSLTGGPVGISVPFVRSAGMMQFASSAAYYALMLGAFLLATLVFALISRSRLGYGLRAIRANSDAAEVIGVDTVRIKVLAATVSAALMGACGVLYAQFNFFFDPDTAFSLVGVSVRVALICIIGGIGTVWGPLVGACFLLPLEEILNSTLSARGAGISQFAFGALLIVIILIEPRGLSALWKRVWSRLSGRAA